MKKNAILMFIIAVAVGAAQSGVVTSNAQAQTLAFNGIGSSALYLQLGQAASGSTPSGLGLTCLWTAGSGQSTGLSAYDTSTGSTIVENGQSWIAWTTDTYPGDTTGTTGTCTPNSSTIVYAYLQTDSVVGDRCLFNGCTVAIGTPGTTAKLIDSGTNANCSTAVVVGQECTTLPSGIQSLFATQPATNGPTVNVAGTDIRPEDAYFATVRAFTGCGTAIAGTQYLGLGYTSPYQQVSSYFSGSKFNIVNFTLPSTYYVDRVGQVPALVVVNQTDGTTNGFANTAITNIDSEVLANFLDGSYSSTEDVSGVTTGNMGVNVVIREPVSGTYNTMEFNVPNTRENQTSQDVGLAQQTAQWSCGINPFTIATASGTRSRAIGTGEALNAVFGGGSLSSYPAGAVLGYGFWSTANFKGAYSGGKGVNWNTNARYLTVDGVDPLMAEYGAYSASPTAQGGAITAYAENAAGTQVTLTTTTANSLSANELVTLEGLEAPLAAFNGQQTVLSSSNPSGGPYSFTIADAVTTASSSGAMTGDAYLGPCATGTCPAGTIPTPSNGGLGAVTLTNVKNGSYPIWSFLRLVCATSAVCSTSSPTISANAAGALTAVGPNFVSFGTASSIPDFVPVPSATVVRSHFLPPGIGALGCSVSNGTTTYTTGFHAAPECGGDVGGVVLTIQGDRDYEAAFQKGSTTKQIGETGLRR